MTEEGMVGEAGAGNWSQSASQGCLLVQILCISDIKLPGIELLMSLPQSRHSATQLLELVAPSGIDVACMYEVLVVSCQGSNLCHPFFKKQTLYHGPIRGRSSYTDDGCKNNSNFMPGIQPLTFFFHTVDSLQLSYWGRLVHHLLMLFIQTFSDLRFGQWMLMSTESHSYLIFSRLGFQPV